MVIKGRNICNASTKAQKSLLSISAHPECLPGHPESLLQRGRNVCQRTDVSASEPGSRVPNRQARAKPETQPLPCGADKGPDSTDTTFRIMYIMFKAERQVRSPKPVTTSIPNTPQAHPRPRQTLSPHRPGYVRTRTTPVWANAYQARILRH